MDCSNAERRASISSLSITQIANPPVCEWRYDEVRDGMDREDCLLRFGGSGFVIVRKETKRPWCRFRFEDM